MDLAGVLGDTLITMFIIFLFLSIQFDLCDWFTKTERRLWLIKLSSFQCPMSHLCTCLD